MSTYIIIAAIIILLFGLKFVMDATKRAAIIVLIAVGLFWVNQTYGVIDIPWQAVQDLYITYSH
jgi:uncharacterized membrane protein